MSDLILYTTEHQKLVKESLDEYRLNPKNTSTWEETKNRILNNSGKKSKTNDK